ncbi:MAG TPA: TonB-dependent receptor [Sulfuricurvum sp.]|nr:MAG: hypothetical protein B7Y30_05845 [Campylobacterales bacterium 16-40-21]OZA02721.1 MAG: hypothetical protein B7X89_08020 [Sulfuricurvum sp. 17-40-25]HQS66738.1 TonB-dependent receptor [Sulfuricurvum sp.]HQT36657.1 TonB-dependent receptor [Sulfuricurvum sp.]
MKILPALFASVLLTQLLLSANDSDDLNSVIEEMTSIATKTKLNADYVPGTVTVISGEKLKSLGITNLAEQNAYDTIVGFDSSTLSLRGAGSIYGSQGNKIKWMINDKPFSAEILGLPILGTGQLVIPIPTDAIERIEIIRGPGSAIYGGNAIYGVINIITKKGAGAVFTTLSQMESNKFGKGIGAYGLFEQNDLKVSTIVSLEQSDGWDLSATSQSRSEHGNLPSASGNNLLMADASYKNIDFWAYRMQAKNNYTRVQWDPTNGIPLDNTKPVQSSINTLLGAQGKYDVFSNVLLTAKAGINQYTNRADLIYPSNSGQRIIDYAESTKYAEGSAETTIGSHRLLGGIYASVLSIDRNNRTQSWNTTNSLLSPKDIPNRINKALYIQDEIQLDEKTTATIGTRYDTYNDGRKALSPRIALVHIYDDSNILKAQYSRAFRPPSFSEQYSSNNQSVDQKFESEIADTLELSYIFKTNDSSIKTTVFNTKTSNMITYHDNTYETINLEHPTTVNGLEMELSKNYETVSLGADMAFYKSHRGEVKLTRTGTDYHYDSSEFALSANFLANVFATINSDTSYPTTLWYHYTGKKNRVNNVLTTTTSVVGTNGSIPAQDYVNVTQKIKGVAKNLDLEFGVKNLFGKTLRTLYFPLNSPNSSDIPYMGQTFWVNLLYKL